MKLNIEKIAQLTGHNASIYALTEGVQVAAQTQTIFSAGGDGWFVRWQLAQPELGQLAAKSTRQIFCLDYEPISNKLLAGDMTEGFVGLTLISLNNRIIFCIIKKELLKLKL